MGIAFLDFDQDTNQRSTAMCLHGLQQLFILDDIGTAVHPQRLFKSRDGKNQTHPRIGQQIAH
ncbi:hypothetical protein D3C73_1062520 [compost metagenome]